MQGRKFGDHGVEALPQLLISNTLDLPPNSASSPITTLVPLGIVAATMPSHVVDLKSPAHGWIGTVEVDYVTIRQKQRMLSDKPETMVPAECLQDAKFQIGLTRLLPDLTLREHSRKPARAVTPAARHPSLQIPYGRNGAITVEDLFYQRLNHAIGQVTSEIENCARRRGHPNPRLDFDHVSIVQQIRTPNRDSFRDRVAAWRRQHEWLIGPSKPPERPPSSCRLPTDDCFGTSSARRSAARFERQR
jgi:hypothetical protein